LAPAPCNSIGGNGSALTAAELQRVNYSAAIETYGELEGEFTISIDAPAVGDVILVRTLGVFGVMRIMSPPGTELTFEWTAIWRDHCFLPGGASCTEACNCPGAK
jgi:hypothetical protein